MKKHTAEEQELLDEFRRKVRCELCSRPTLNGLDPHHIYSRGAGAPTVRVNLVALCRACHQNAHAGRVPRAALKGIVCEREGVAFAEIKEAVDQYRRVRP